MTDEPEAAAAASREAESREAAAEVPEELVATGQPVRTAGAANPAGVGSEVVYVVAAVLLTGFVLSRFVDLVDDYLRVEYSWLLEVGMVAGQVLFQWGVLWRFPFAEKWRYAVQVITVSLLGAVLLVPLVAWDVVSAVSPVAAAVYFFAVVGVMFVDHWRRVKRLGLPWVLCGTWVLYRVFLLMWVADWRLL